MNSESKNYRVIIVILLLAAVATIIYLVSLKLAYPLFQNTRLADPLAELHSLFPLYYIAIGIIVLSGVACFVFRIQNRGIHLLLLLLLAIMLWYTPNYLAGYVHQPDGPRDLGVALEIPQVLHGVSFPNAGYGLDFPTSYILSYSLMHITGIEPLSYLHLFPLISLCLFTLLCYVFASRLFSPLAAFITTLLAMIGLHYIFFLPGAHAVGVLLLVTALVLLWRQDTTSRILTFLAIAAVIICHPISPLLLTAFLAAALIVNFSRRLVKSQVVVMAMLVVCIGGWFIWPSLPLAAGLPAEIPSVTEETSEWAGDLQGYIFPSELETTELFLLGTPFIYGGIFNLNKGVYLLYALLALAAIGYIFYRSSSQRRRPRDFIKNLGGLSRGEAFLVISVLVLIILTILLGEREHVLIERGLTFTILAISGLVASITIRTYEPATIVVKRFIGLAMIVVVLFLTLSFPVVAYSIDAYTSFPISEEAGLKFLADCAPLNTKTLAITAEGQMTLYRPYIVTPVKLRSRSSLDQGDIFAFRRSGYYYAAMRHELSFEDNWFTRYQSVANTSSEFDRIYSSPTTVIFMKIGTPQDESSLSNPRISS
jgi:hypothetical protein